MNLELTGKLALVTGSTAGIGYAIAEALAREGARVIVNGRTAKRVEQAIKQIRSSVPQAQLESLATDLGNAEGARTTVQRFSEVEILINNLGIFEPKSFEQIPDEDWFRFFEVNVMSGVRLSRAYLPGMRRRNWGRIVFVSSESGLNIPADMIHYGFTKTANLSISRGIAKRVAGTGVTVNAVLPGPTLTEGVEAMLKESAQEAGQSVEVQAAAFVKAHRPSSIIQRAATPEEVANMVVYVCSKQASATTG